MAVGGRRLLKGALVVGTFFVLFAAFSSSGHSLTLVLGTLFVTLLGMSVLFGSATERKGRRIHADTKPSLGGGRDASQGSEELPDPLSMDFDVPL